MTKRDFTITGKVWKYSGPAGWYFIYVPKKESEEIKKMNGVVKVGFSFIPIIAKIGNSEWKTTLFPTKEGVYLISIKANIRKKEDI